MFDINDLYSVSAGVNVFNYWNPFVTKHDTSSFYNWEQDNLPLYDLEERTLYLWEKFGYPLSGVPGMAYVVSSSVDSSIALSSNMFTSLSAAIDSLPEIIRMPTLIEVADSGDLGELNLNNIKCVEDGVLEIVNRAFAPISDNSGSMYLSITDMNLQSQSYIPTYMTGDSSGMLGTLSSTSAISVSANTSSLMGSWVNDTTDDSYPRNFILPGRSKAPGAINHFEIPGYLQVGVAGAGSAWLKNMTAGNIYCNSITYSTGSPTNSKTQDLTITSLDLSTTEEYTGNAIHPGIFTDEQLARGIWANNYCRKITAQNCDGPIYIRGFIADGESSRTTGIGIYNCNDLTLENCGAMRNTEIGFDIKNSNINLRRQAFAGRNYDTADRGTLTTYGFKFSDSDVKFVTDAYVSGGSASFASHFHDYGLYLENSVVTGGDPLSGSLLYQTTDFYTDIGYNKTGIYCSNSKYSMNGTTNVYMSYNNIEAKNSTIQVEQLRNMYSQNIGLWMNNSDFRYNKNLSLSAVGGGTANRRPDTSPGAAPSIFIAPIFHNYPIEFSNNGQNVVLKGGSTYTPTYSDGVSGVDMTNLYNQEIYYAHHGQVSGLGTAKPGVVVDNSVGEFTCGKFISPSNSTNDPTIPLHLFITNNGTAIVRGLSDLGAAPGYDGITGNRACYFDGTSDTQSTAIIADNNSNLFLTGPVAIYNNGTGIAVLNGSKLQTTPPLDHTDSYLDYAAGNQIYNYALSGWAFGAKTAPNVLEIQAQGDCLLADNQSQIILEDLGDFSGFWGTTWTSSIDYQSYNWGPDSIASAGALQFYPNHAKVGVMDYTIPSTNFSGMDILGGQDYSPEMKYDTGLSCVRILYQGDYDSVDTDTEFQEVAHGGMCVRATNNSTVKVKNVHFPMGHKPADWSYYDLSGSPAGCGHLMIWNIADTSKLQASYTTVSGQYPLYAGYTGPRSFYTMSGGVIEGVDNDSSAVLYGLPSGTSHTGALSVLDHYGSAVAVSATYTYTYSNPTCASDTSCIARAIGEYPLSATRGFMSKLQEERTGVDAGTNSTYGAADFQNRGPFRLYFSVLPAAKKLFYLSGVGGPHPGPSPGEFIQDYGSDTRPYQHLSQGYLLQGNCSAHFDFSGVYPQVLNMNTYNTSGILTTSGYFYPEDIMPKERASVWLEKSAANTFSNAKHCNTDYSNRIKLVNIYDTKVNEWGGSFIGDISGLGQGFRTSNISNLQRRT